MLLKTKWKVMWIKLRLDRLLTFCHILKDQAHPPGGMWSFPSELEAVQSSSEFELVKRLLAYMCAPLKINSPVVCNKDCPIQLRFKLQILRSMISTINDWKFIKAQERWIWRFAFQL